MAGDAQGEEEPMMPITPLSPNVSGQRTPERWLNVTIGEAGQFPSAAGLV